MLRRLVVVAAGEPLAARIVLQRLLPGLLAIVRREQQRDRGVDAFDLLAGEAWMAIITYRADLRPTDVAARLLNDARHRAFTTPRRRQERSREDVVPPARLDLPRLPQPGSSFEELTSVLRDARRDGSGDDDLAAVRDYLAGHHGGRPGGRTRASAPRTAAQSPPARRSSGSAGSPPRPTSADRQRSNFGGRFSRNAAMPSWASAVVAAAAIV